MKMLDERMLQGLTDTEKAELFRLLRGVLGNLEEYAEELTETDTTPEQEEE